MVFSFIFDLCSDVCLLVYLEVFSFIFDLCSDVCLLVYHEDNDSVSPGACLTLCTWGVLIK